MATIQSGDIPGHPRHMILWPKRHWQCVFAVFRYRNQEIFQGEKFWKTEMALVKKIFPFPVKPRPPRQSSECMWCDPGGFWGFFISGAPHIWPCANMVKNDENGKKNPKMAKICRFERLIQNFWQKITFWPIFNPFW